MNFIHEGSITESYNWKTRVIKKITGLKLFNNLVVQQSFEIFIQLSSKNRRKKTSKTMKALEELKGKKLIFHFLNFNFFSFTEFRKFLIWMNNLIGLQMEKFTFHPRFVVVIFLLITFNTMLLNGCYENLNDPYKLIHAITPAAIVIVFTAKLYTALFWNWQNFDPIMFAKTLKFYEKYENDPKLSEILSRRAAECIFNTKLFITLIFVSFNILPATSFANFLLTGEKVLFSYNYLPFTNPNETFDFLLNLALLAIILLIGSIAFAAPESFCTFYSYQVVVQCDVLCFRLNELAKSLLELKHEASKMIKLNNKNNRWVTVKEIIKRKNYEEKVKKIEREFIEIVKEHREYDLFIKEMTHFMKISFFFVITCNSFTIGMCVILIFKISIPMGIAGGE